MQYKGELYTAKINGKHIMLDVTAADIDKLVDEAEKLIEMVKAPAVISEREFIKELYATADRAQELINKIKGNRPK
jgi:hypothetical protein